MFLIVWFQFSESDTLSCACILLLHVLVRRREPKPVAQTKTQIQREPPSHRAPCSTPMATQCQISKRENVIISQGMSTLPLLGQPFFSHHLYCLPHNRCTHGCLSVIIHPFPPSPPLCLGNSISSRGMPVVFPRDELSW